MGQNNRMFDEMMKAARAWLSQREPGKIAERAGVEFADGAFHFRTLGVAVTVSYPAWEITPALDSWHQLAVLHYLNLADGTPLTGKPITFAQQKDGMVRGGGFDRKVEGCLRQLDQETLKRNCKELGGREKRSSADYCVELSVLPRYPVTLNYWMADEEFPASGRLLQDSSAEHYLTIEDSVMVGELLLERLGRKSSPVEICEKTHKTT